MSYYQQQHNQPGYIYLMEAKGYHGIVPGCLIKRCKIGLSRNPEARLDTFHNNQPPCNIEIIKTIFVDDMEAVESQLHKDFKHCNVKLLKSREWFDLNPVDYQRVLWEMRRYEGHIISVRQLISPLLMIAGLLVLGYSAIPQNESKPIEAKPALQTIRKIVK